MIQIQQGLQTLQQEAPGVLTGLGMSAPPLGPGSVSSPATSASNNASQSPEGASTAVSGNETVRTTDSTTTSPTVPTSESTAAAPNQTELATLLASMLNMMSNSTQPGSGNLPGIGDALRASQAPTVRLFFIKF